MLRKRACVLGASPTADLTVPSSQPHLGTMEQAGQGLWRVISLQCDFLGVSSKHQQEPRRSRCPVSVGPQKTAGTRSLKDSAHRFDDKCNRVGHDSGLSGVAGARCLTCHSPRHMGMPGLASASGFRVHTDVLDGISRI